MMMMTYAVCVFEDLINHDNYFDGNDDLVNSDFFPDGGSLPVQALQGAGKVCFGVGDHFDNLEHVSHTLHSHSQLRFHHLFHNVVEEGDYDEDPSREDGNPPSYCHLVVEMFRGTIMIIANFAW